MLNNKYQWMWILITLLFIQGCSDESASQNSINFNIDSKVIVDGNKVWLNYKDLKCSANWELKPNEEGLLTEENVIIGGRIKFNKGILNNVKCNKKTICNEDRCTAGKYYIDLDPEIGDLEDIDFEGIAFVSDTGIIEKEVVGIVEKKDYELEDVVSFKENKGRYELKTIDGLECDFLWDSPVAPTKTSDKINFRQGRFSDINCNQEYTQEGDIMTFESGWVLDIDPEFYHTQTSDWTGDFSQTQTDGENITLADQNDTNYIATLNYVLSGVPTTEFADIAFDDRDNTLWILDRNTDGAYDAIYHRTRDGTNLSGSIGLDTIIPTGLQGGMAFNGSDFWVGDDVGGSANDWVYHIDENGDNITVGFDPFDFGCSSPSAITYDTRDETLWMACSSQTDMYHIYTNGSLIASWDYGFTNPGGQGVAFDDRDNTFWLSDNSGIVSHLDEDGNNLTGGFSISEINIAMGITMDTTDYSFWLAGRDDDKVWHFDHDYLFSEGNYTSLSFDATQSVSWDNISWNSTIFWKNELPDNTASDWFDMTGNTHLYHLNNNDGSDTSGNNNDGTMEGELDCTGDEGKLNNGCNFTGTDTGYIDLGTRIDWSTGTRSLSMWVYIVDNETVQAIYVSTASSSNRYGIQISSGDIRVSFYDSGYKAVSGSITDDMMNKWNHIVVIKYSDNKVNSLYINNVNQTGTASTGNSGTAGMRLGLRTDGTAPFNGSIDEVAIWNRILSVSEIADIYENQRNGYNIENNGTQIINISMEYRTSQDDTNWDAWVEVNNGYGQLNDSARYFQYRAYLNTSDTDYTPYLQDVNVTYTVLDTVPTFFGASFLPDPAYTNDTLNASIGCQDEESTEISMNLTWSNDTGAMFSFNGSFANGTYTQWLLEFANTTRGEYWCANVTCNDGVNPDQSSDLGCVNISNSLPYFNDTISQQNPQAGDETNYTLTCYDIDSNLSMTYSDNVSGTAESYYTRFVDTVGTDPISAIMQFRPSWFEFLNPPEVDIECIDDWGDSSGNQTFKMNVTGPGGVVGTCNLDCLIISDGCLAYESASSTCTQII